MTRQNNVFFAASLAAVLTLGATSSAQFSLTLNNDPGFSQSVSRSYSRSVGSSWLGVSGYAWGYMRGYRMGSNTLASTTSTNPTLASAHARGYLSATGRILKQSRTLGRFDSRGDVYSRKTGVTMSGSYRLVLAGSTVMSKSFSKTVSYPRFERYVSLFPTDPRADIPVGPFTLTLKGNAGVGVQAYTYAALSSTPAVNVYGVAKAWGQGRANVEFGIFGFGVGAEAKAKLAQQTFSASLRPSKSGLRGRADWSMVALTLKLRAYAYAFWGAASYSNTVLSRSYGSISRNLFSL